MADSQTLCHWWKPISPLSVANDALRCVRAPFEYSEGLAPTADSQLEDFVNGKMLMARPSAASLNSLADILRQAQPLYQECRSILNYLDEMGKSAPWRESESRDTAQKWIPANQDAASTSLTTFERKRRYGKGVV